MNRSVDCLVFILEPRVRSCYSVTRGRDKTLPETNQDDESRAKDSDNDDDCDDDNR